MSRTPKTLIARLQRSFLAPKLLAMQSAARRTVVNNSVTRWAYAPAAGSLPLPPAGLMHLVQNSTDPALYMWGGFMAADDIKTFLFRNSLSMEKFTSILDFGCGCGRVIRYWRGVPGELHGTDYNPGMIRWCQRNLPFRFNQNGLDPPLSFRDEQFDFIYAFSVFTHLDAARQLRWMAELTRTLRRGGYLLLTTHGTRHLRMLDEQERREFDEGRLVVRFASDAGANACLAFHPESWVRSHLAGEAVLLDYAPWGASGLMGHDMYLFRRGEEIVEAG